jgi:hypothetical protein
MGTLPELIVKTHSELLEKAVLHSSDEKKNLNLREKRKFV